MVLSAMIAAKERANDTCKVELGDMKGVVGGAATTSTQADRCGVEQFDT